MRIRFEFKPQDLSVGVFWKTTSVGCPCGSCRDDVLVDVWVCLLPCVPLHVSWLRPWRECDRDPKSVEAK